jgi:Fur family ferric uptake transcriptional regulator
MTSDIDELQDVLRRSGQRLTPQRMMVLSALAQQGGHVTAETILEMVRPDYPYINLSTVYRTLDMLVELGVVAETDLGGGVRQFELLGAQPHHHLICQRCGTTIEVGDEVLQPLRERLQNLYDFEPRMDHFAIFGICARCRDLMADPSTDN